MSIITPLFGAANSWRSSNTRLFPTEASLRWFLRQNKRRLVAAGAIVLLRDAWMAVEPQMSQTVLAIGTERAQTAVDEVTA